MVDVVVDEEIIESEELSEEQIAALDDPARVEILKMLADQPSYPAEVSEKLGYSKQRTYYHFKKLEEAGLIEEAERKQKSGGEAVYYRPSSPSWVLNLELEGESFPLPERDNAVIRFLDTLVEDGELEGFLVAGSPRQHGEDQVRALDGHLAGEIAFKLGNYSRNAGKCIMLDTEIISEDLTDTSMLLIGGVLTNVVAKKFKDAFPAGFPGEEFPYRRLKTPENSYRDSEIGVISKTPNPENMEEQLFLVAGVESAGTRAAVLAFRDLENIVEDYSSGRFYAVVRGLDLNSDGEIDDYEVVEKSE